MMGPGAGNTSTSFLLLGSVVLISLITPTVLGHGRMLQPPTWMNLQQQCSLKFNTSGVSCDWFNNFTHIPGEPTLDPSMSTFPQLWNNSLFATKVLRSYSTKNPWFSPGSAPIYSPCGVAGGNPYGCPEGSSQNIGDWCPRGGWAYGPKAEDYYVDPGFPDVVTTEWRAGAVVEAVWRMGVNHGGGYAYRLCKVPEEGMGALTEECFQKSHLEFFGDKLAIQTGENVNSRVEYEALKTKEGTFPKGSQWTRNPIPNCLFNEDEPEINQEWFIPGIFDPKCSIGTQFPPLAPGLLGNGYWIGPSGVEHFNYFDFSIVDQLKVPSHLTPGDYVLSFRWDSEQEAQIYTQCSNIKIV